MGEVEFGWHYYGCKIYFWGEDMYPISRPKLKYEN
jgi:hypothetical protein